MADKMLIDASHEEETRVVVVRGNRIEEFDFESQHKKQLRGNIYLAKVTRVEPSLQAAFVDYGGNRHGFLAFSEIHPDYYQIPLADRQALLAAEAEAEAERARSENDEDDGEEQVAAPEEPEGAEKEEAPKGRNRRGRRRKTAKAEESADSEEQAEIDEAVKDLEGADEPSEDEDEDRGPGEMAAVVETESVSEAVPAVEDEDRDPGEVDEEAANHVEGKSATPLPGRDAAEDADEDEEKSGRRRRSRSRRNDQHDDGEDENGGKVESVGAEDALEEVPDRSVRKPRKQYRIQEVIKRRQILLVQVVKEERGNKGAALTTYLSLAGRYSVLMPNTARGGGISRKITNVPDRKRLKEIARGLDVPQGMGVILRTAGANRTKAEIKRDFEYLMRLWENVRSLTLASTAPCLVYEEGSLIKRSIRDLYNKDIGEVVVSGEEGYREAKDFMKMLMPSHAKVVQPYREVHPIFSRSGIEAQLDRMLQPQVTLKSGGYIIINQTEALVAIDVNSGRSTKEHSIEDTALQTNLEAADEVARQLRLRDLAGLIVVDFIDMEEKRNNRSVEKRLKDALKNDRARIQVGRISHFGLLEMSRQRIRASVLESTTQICEHCGGTGHVRSQSSVALHVIRSIEEFLLKSTTHDITVRTMPETALYVLNQKRETIVEMERRFGVSITIEADATIGSAHLAIDRGAPVEAPVRIADLVQQETAYADEDDDAVPTWDDEAEEEEAAQPSAAPSRSEESDDQRRRKRRRRRRGGRGRQDGEDQAEQLHGDAEAEADEGDADEVEHASGDEGQDERPRKRRRRGKRGGRRNRGGDEAPHAATAGTEESDETDSVGLQDSDEAAESEAPVEASAERSEPKATPAAVEPAEAAIASESLSEEPAPAEEEEKPKKRRASRAKKAETAGEAAEEKPKRARRSKKATVAEEQAEPAPEAEAVVEAEQPVDAVEETAAAPVEAESALASDRAAPAEKVAPVVTSNGRNGDEPEAAEQKPKKVGWWQRRGFF